MKRALLIVIILCVCISPAFADNSWSEGSDINNDGVVDGKDFATMAKYWLVIAPALEITWVDINDLGFNGQMSKYEITNAQYCDFLNEALISEDIIVNGIYIEGADGSNSGADFAGQVYYNLAGGGFTYNGATNGGAARISFTDGAFTVESGFKNHPVTYVSWYGATAFCNYYGYKLPTELQWQAVADHDGSYDYGCGSVINTSIANIFNSTHPDGTVDVGSLGNPAGYGYGICDLTGNVWEWTDSWYTDDQNHRVIKGGSWNNSSYYCSVSYRHYKTPSAVSSDVGFRVWRNFEPNGIVLIDISDPGFVGLMSKHEITNLLYCHFLNSALATGDISVEGDYVKGASGSNSGQDFQGQDYYYLEGTGYTSDGAIKGGAAHINWTGSSFTIDSGYENHPVTYVSWYGATAFCNYYGYRLPTEWQWEAVADYDGSFIYGCGTTINNNIANYEGSTHPDGTTDVGSFGAYGYWMCDMAGNVWEWTDSLVEPESSGYIIRGGSWAFSDINCRVSERYYYSDPDLTFSYLGFRVCR